MDKTEIIIRRILGWKLNSYNKWFDPVNGKFIDSFNMEKNLDDAMLVVKQLEKYGFVYSKKSDTEICFNDICAKGKNLNEAIMNAAYEVAEVNSVPDEWL